MSFKFEKLEIWKLAIDFANDVHILSRKFPKEEMYSLTSQFKRAADSIALNISEGSIGHTNAEQSRFLQYSIRSMAECISCLHLSIKRNYISLEEFQIFYQKLEVIFAKTMRFKKNLNIDH